MDNVARLTFLTIDRNSDVPIYIQVTRGIRDAILDGRLRAGTRLLASRQVAEFLKISRLPVQNAYEQLIIEGHLISRRGAGTYVTGLSNKTSIKSDSCAGIDSVLADRLTERSKHISASTATLRLDQNRPFRPGIPAMDLFPRKIWLKSMRRATDQFLSTDYSYGDASGLPEFREQIAQHLRISRGVRCDADQIIVTAGAQQAFSMIAFALLDPGAPVWLEDPGHIAARDAMSSMNAQVYPVPVDDEGLNISDGSAQFSAPDLIFVTPSHQHPLGMTMSESRRAELLEFAAQNKSWIIEDDYDGEYRYTSRPLNALQGIDQHDLVIYVGSFSKTLFPGLRLGYIVAPRDLVDVFRAAQGILTYGCSALTQAATADFMRMGHYESHVQKMRQAYQKRAKLLIKVLKRHAGQNVTISEPEAGLHVIASLNSANPDTVCKALWKAKINALPLSVFALRANVPPALVLGFASATPEEIETLGKQTAEIISMHSH